MTRRRLPALRILGMAVWFVLMLVPAALAATPIPSPSASSGDGLGAGGSGAGYVVLAAILIGALVFSTWRLRRER